MTAQLSDTYTSELAYLTAMGADRVQVVQTGGGCTAVQADINGRRVLATNTDGGLLSTEDLAAGEPGSWSLGIYEIDEIDGEALVAEGFGVDLAAAYNAARDCLQRGDFIAD